MSSVARWLRQIIPYRIRSHTPQSRTPFPTHIGKPKERVHETPSQGILSHPPIPLLLWSRADPEGKQSEMPGGAAGRGSASPQRISRTPVEGGDAEAAQPQDHRTEPAMCDLLGGVHELQRHRTRPHRSERNGRVAERRPSRQYPGCPLLVQRGKGLYAGVLVITVPQPSVVAI
jgi:hypothetical protein